MYKRNSHCSYCGNPFDENQPWPRKCSFCGNSSYVNPTPVSVVLLPVDDGLLLIRRGIEPKKGMLALPGGFISLGETWQQAATRELMEETGIDVDPGELKLFNTLSAPDGTLLVFGLAKKRRFQTLPTFSPTDETTEYEIVTEPKPLAFSLHEQILEEYFQKKRSYEH